MSHYSVKNFGAVLERLPQHIDYRFDITTYDDDNLYPQRIEQVMVRSSITGAAINAKADFVNGEGFSSNPDLVLNRNGQTVNEVLAWTSKQYSINNGFAWVLNTNLLGEIVEVLPLDFKYPRFGLPNAIGKHDKIRVNLNWEKDAKKFPQGNAEIIVDFPIWPMDQEKAVDTIAEFDGDFETEFRGFVLYWTPQKDVYPRCSFDPVLDSSQAEGEIQVFELANVQNGFLGATVFRHPGTIESEEERGALLNDLAGVRGAGNANSVILVETPDDFDGSLLEPIPANSQADLFQTTNENVVRRILQNYSQPLPIVGVQPDGGIFNQQEIEDSYTYYNLRTKSDRMIMERIFGHIGENWITPFEVGNVIEQEFKAGDEEHEEEVSLVAMVKKGNGRNNNNRQRRDKVIP